MPADVMADLPAKVLTSDSLYFPAQAAFTNDQMQQGGLTVQDMTMIVKFNHFGNSAGCLQAQVMVELAARQAPTCRRLEHPPGCRAPPGRSL